MKEEYGMSTLLCGYDSGDLATTIIKTPSEKWLNKLFLK